MKKSFITLFSLWILLSINYLQASEAQEPSFILKVVTEQANIREKPDLGSRLICQVPEGTILQSFGKRGEWYLVSLKTEEEKIVSGYVHESLVVKTEDIPPAEIPEIKRPVKEEEEKKPIIHKTPAVTLPERSIRIKYTISLSGGGNYIAGKDLNSGTKGFARFFDDELGIEGEVQGNPLNLGYIIGGELGVAITPEFLFSIGCDYFLAEKERLAEYDVNGTKATFTSNPKIQAIPVRAAFSYFFLPSFYIKGGAEYFFAKCSYSNRFETTNSWEEKNGRAHGSCLGILGAVGAELILASNLTFFIEATGRYARVNKLKGEGTRMNSLGFNYTEDGTLYLYHRLSSNENAFPQVEVRERKPAAGGEIDPRREAVLDFSGISLKIGFRLIF